MLPIEFGIRDQIFQSFEARSEIVVNHLSIKCGLDSISFALLARLGVRLEVDGGGRLEEVAPDSSFFVRDFDALVVVIVCVWIIR